MARLGTLKKQPGETLPFTISYADVVGSSTVDSLTCVVTMPAGITKAAQVLSGTTLQVFVSGGITGYVGTVQVVATIIIGGNTTIVEDEVVVRVKEIS